MAQKPYVITHQQREQRQQSYLAAPVLGKKFPHVNELVVEMRFADPEGKVRPSPIRRIFTADMQAFFDFQCPLRDCGGGGFDLTAGIEKRLSNRKVAGAEKVTCHGHRDREGRKNQPCLLELEYQLVVEDRRKAAA